MTKQIALAGRVVAMDKARTVVSNGVVYVQDASVVDVRPMAASPPAGFESVPVVHTRGTIFPGLIELHNHLPYDVLSLWQVPKQYGNRDQWSGSSTPSARNAASMFFLEMPKTGRWFT